MQKRTRALLYAALLISMAAGVLAQVPVPGHPASQIGPGVFFPGDYEFTNNASSTEVTVRNTNAEGFARLNLARNAPSAWIAALATGIAGFAGGPLALQVWNAAAGAIVFGTSNTERMRIDAAGNIGIGSTAPTARLEVNGGIRLNTSAPRPACDAATRGTLWYEQGTPEDKLHACMRNAAASYNWVLVARGG